MNDNRPTQGKIVSISNPNKTMHKEQQEGGAAVWVLAGAFATLICAITIVALRCL